MQQPERGSAVAGVDVLQGSKVTFGESTVWATSVLLQEVVECGAVRKRSVSGSTKAFSIYFEDDYRWPRDFCNAVVADARAQGAIIQPRIHSDSTSQKSGVKRKQCV